jgi:hypothetical protein
VIYDRKMALLKDSNRLSGVFITGKSIMNTNNSADTVFKKFEIVSGRACVDQVLEVGWGKIGDEKSRDCSLNSAMHFFIEDAKWF